MKPSQQGVLPSNPRKGLVSKLTSEFRHFQTYPHGMRVLLITNLLYSLVLPVVEMFIGAYIMRNSSDSTLVVCFQLASYTGIPITFLINGFLLRRFRIATLYSFGMLLSGISMSIMMTLSDLDTTGVVVAGLVMGLSYGFSGRIGISWPWIRPTTTTGTTITGLKPFSIRLRVSGFPT